MIAVNLGLGPMRSTCHGIEAVETVLMPEPANTLMILEDRPNVRMPETLIGIWIVRKVLDGWSVRHQRINSCSLRIQPEHAIAISINAADAI